MMFTELPHFKYQDGDWVKEYGIPEHHLRIIIFVEMEDGGRWYMTYDTTLQQGYSEYKWRWADELEAKSELVQHADGPAHLQLILARCLATWHLKYSIPARLDCESLQRFIQTGQEEDRWSPQVWTGIGIVAVVGLVFALANQKQGKRA